MTFSKPSKSQLSDYLQERREQGGPPPTPERIRELLGWNLVQAERDSDNERRSA